MLLEKITFYFELRPINPTLQWSRISLREAVVVFLFWLFLPAKADRLVFHAPPSQLTLLLCVFRCRQVTRRGLSVVFRHSETASW